MKKLFLGLFALTSAAIFAQTDAAGIFDPNCYTSACSVEREFKVKVHVPTQLKITKLNDIDLGKWCGTKPLSGKEEFELSGESGAKVDVEVVGLKRKGLGFEENGQNLEFTTPIDIFGNNKLQGTISAWMDDNHLDGSGKGKGTVKAEMTPGNAIGKTFAGQTYTAHAKLKAKYSGDWGL